MTIAGSTSLIAKSLCDGLRNSDINKIYLIGRRKPEWANDHTNIEFIACDFSEQINLDEFFSSIHKDVDFSGLVYLPSAQFGRLKLTELARSEVIETIQVSLINAILIVRSYSIVAPRSGSVVLFSSQAANFGGNQISPYAAAKGGIESFVKGIARELGPLNIRINALSPGVINTETLAKYATELVELTAAIPMGRLGSPQDVTKAINWLMSKESEYMSGAIIALTGGR